MYGVRWVCILYLYCMYSVLRTVVHIMIIPADHVTEIPARLPWGATRPIVRQFKRDDPLRPSTEATPISSCGSCARSQDDREN